MTFPLLVAFALAAVSAPVFAAEIYSGEPLGEALYDLDKSAVLVSHEMVSATPLVRCDVFRLRDARLVAITSRAHKLGEPYTIETLRITSSADQKLSKTLPTVASLKLPDPP